MAQPGPDPPALRLELLAPVLAREVALQGPAGVCVASLPTRSLTRLTAARSTLGMAQGAPW